MRDQRIEFGRWLTGGSASTLHLSFGNHAHDFDAVEDDAGATKFLESQHRAHASVDGQVAAPNLQNDVGLDANFSLDV